MRSSWLRFSSFIYWLLRNQHKLLRGNTLYHWIIRTLNKTDTWCIFNIEHRFLTERYTNVPILNLLAPEFYIQILAHPVCKMWIIHEPKKVALWNKRYFGEKNGECASRLKYSVLIIFMFVPCISNIKIPLLKSN